METCLAGMDADPLEESTMQAMSEAVEEGAGAMVRLDEAACSPRWPTCRSRQPACQAGQGTNRRKEMVKKILMAELILGILATGIA